MHFHELMRFLIFDFHFIYVLFHMLNMFMLSKKLYECIWYILHLCVLKADCMHEHIIHNYRLMLMFIIMESVTNSDLETLY